MSATIEPGAASGCALSSLTRQYDPVTLALCERLGLTEGWHCLDVGAGAGSVVELLAERVGDEGSVLAVDLETGSLESLVGPRVRVRQWDVTAEPLPRDAFDLVHA